MRIIVKELMIIKKIYGKIDLTNKINIEKHWTYTIIIYNLQIGFG